MRKSRSRFDEYKKFFKVVGARLRRLRLKKGLSIAKVAQEAKISSKTIKYMEEGTKDYRILTLDRICKYYGTTVYNLLEDL